MQARSDPPKRASETGTNGAREAVQRWRLVISRTALPAARGQREQLSEWDAALIASGLPIAGLDAARPRARMAFAAPLSASIPGEAELLDVWLVERLPRWRVREALAAVTPPGFAIVDLFDVWLGEPPLPGRVAASVYRATVHAEDPGRLASAAETLLAATELPRQRRKGEGTVAYDLRPFLASIEVIAASAGEATIRMILRHDPTKGLGRPDETLAALGEAMGGPPLEADTLVRERLVLIEPTPPEPPPPKGPRRLPPAAAPPPGSRRSQPPPAGR